MGTSVSVESILVDLCVVMDELSESDSGLSGIGTPSTLHSDVALIAVYVSSSMSSSSLL